MQLVMRVDPAVVILVPYFLSWSGISAFLLFVWINFKGCTIFQRPGSDDAAGALQLIGQQGPQVHVQGALCVGPQPDAAGGLQKGGHQNVDVLRADRQQHVKDFPRQPVRLRQDRVVKLDVQGVVLERNRVAVRAAQARQPVFSQRRV